MLDTLPHEHFKDTIILFITVEMKWISNAPLGNKIYKDE